MKLLAWSNLTCIKYTNVCFLQTITHVIAKKKKCISNLDKKLDSLANALCIHITTSCVVYGFQFTDAHLSLDSCILTEAVMQIYTRDAREDARGLQVHVNNISFTFRLIFRNRDNVHRNPPQIDFSGRYKLKQKRKRYSSIEASWLTYSRGSWPQFSVCATRKAQVHSRRDG